MICPSQRVGDDEEVFGGVERLAGGEQFASEVRAELSGHVEEIKSQKLSIHGHALRRSYSVFGRMAGVPHPIVKQLLNHAGSDVTEKHYTPHDPMLDFLREQQEKISRYIVEKLKAA
jgi:integrase